MLCFRFLSAFIRFNRPLSAFTYPSPSFSRQLSTFMVLLPTLIDLYSLVIDLHSLLIVIGFQLPSDFTYNVGRILTRWTWVARWCTPALQVCYLCLILFFRSNKRVWYPMEALFWSRGEGVESVREKKHVTFIALNAMCAVLLYGSTGSIPHMHSYTVKVFMRSSGILDRSVHYH